jgi:hypothetical protein
MVNWSDPGLVLQAVQDRAGCPNAAGLNSGICAVTDRLQGFNYQRREISTASGDSLLPDNPH